MLLCMLMLASQSEDRALASVSEIKKQGMVTYLPLSYPFILARNVSKNNTWISIIAAEKKLVHVR